MRKHYYANITQIDDWVGEIVAAVEARGQLDNTVFVFTSDHGDCLGDHHQVYKFSSHYDAVARVPLAALADPANRIQVGHPSGYVGPGFLVAGLLVWGFTGGLLSALLDLGGWARPWEPTRVLDLDEAWSRARAQA